MCDWGYKVKEEVLQSFNEYHNLLRQMKVMGIDLNDLAKFIATGENLLDVKEESLLISYREFQKAFSSLYEDENFFISLVYIPTGESFWALENILKPGVTDLANSVTWCKDATVNVIFYDPVNQEEIAVTPEWMVESGTPIDDNGVDMKYLRTEVS